MPAYFVIAVYGTAVIAEALAGISEAGVGGPAGGADHLRALVALQGLLIAPAPLPSPTARDGIGGVVRRGEQSARQLAHAATGGL